MYGCFQMRLTTKILKQQSVAEPDKVEEEYEKVIASLSPEQEEAITKYCDAIFSSGANTEEFFIAWD